MSPPHHRTISRHGSLLFLLITLLAVLAVMTYAFVRAVQLTATSAKADSLLMLTQGAAQAGLDHAVENILRDYASTSVTLRYGNSARAQPPINDPPTFLEGAWRQPFTGLRRPNNFRMSERMMDVEDPTAWDEVRPEDLINAPMLRSWNNGYQIIDGGSFGKKDQGMSNSGWMVSFGGFTYHDGQGRYYEPNYFNRLNPQGSLLPTAPVRFTDPDPTLTAPVSSTAPLMATWLDSRLRPMDPGLPIDQQRRLARYRLRYAVGVEDIDGSLLANGDAWLTKPYINSTDPNSAPVTTATDTTPTVKLSSLPVGTSGYESNEDRVRRLVRWAPVYFNLVRGAITHRELALRAEHVFLNRGGASNHDYDAQGFPVTFPLMWRTVEEQTGNIRYYNRFLQFFDSPSRPVPHRLYSFMWGALPITIPLKDGGSPLSGMDSSFLRDSFMTRPRAVRSRFGPQYSADTLRFAVLDGIGSDALGADTTANAFQRVFTPFGRGMTRMAKPGLSTPEERARYQAPAGAAGQADYPDVPWHLNLLTATPVAVSSMLKAYIPWRTQTVRYSTATAEKNGTPYEWTNSGGKKFEALAIFPFRDCFNRVFSPAFPYHGPRRDEWMTATSKPDPDNGQVDNLEPNWFLGEQNISSLSVGGDVRTGKDRYPGPLMIATTTSATLTVPELTAGQGADDCGAEVYNLYDDAQKPGHCIYTTMPFFFPPTDYEAGRYGVAPDASLDSGHPISWAMLQQEWAVKTNGWNNLHLFLGTTRYLHSKSYFLDMTWALTDVISAARMQWSQYDSQYITAKPSPNSGYWQVASRPQDHFIGSAKWDPTEWRTLADIDRVWLANLGIDITAPDSDRVAQGWKVHGNWGDNPPDREVSDPSNWTLGKADIATNNIRTLRKGDKLAVDIDPATAAIEADPSGRSTSLNRSRVMELVLNDMRMSFLGSSPEYDKNLPTGFPYLGFVPLDFNGDGVVHASCLAPQPGVAIPPPPSLYAHEGAGTTTGAMADELRLTQWKPAPVTPDQINYRFSVSGNFFIGKSRHYRVVSRGEVWDNLVQRPVSALTMESVIAVDPQAQGANGVNRTHTLSQRYYWNKYRGTMSRLDD